ncbi:AraC family transcriptional regulator [Paenibacillus sp. J53TS2]|uniref:response regulator n=1 Tax=Paenibacillus sp. J53TS2 TaxID=2807197 RepID=UPI001B1C66C4|nr:response regulator [Paenibacillus sp. J53TS2]GIP49793.1 AraC family transcriptional regulator [Paenibacillus sp. J53TS2]
MYSIFLVDDEELELEMMRDFIRWEDMGIYVAGVGINGKDAQEKIHAIQPDIVLTDVQMPLMDGLELAKWVSEYYDWMQIVFLTGHDEFNYVKSALHVGAVGYLLKPLDLEEITGVMGRVKQKCEEVRLKYKSIQMTKAKLLKELLHEKDAVRRLQLAAALGKLERREVAGTYTLALCSVDRFTGGETSGTGEAAISRLPEVAEEYFHAVRKDAVVAALQEGELAIFIEAEPGSQPGVSHEQWGTLQQTIRGLLGLSVTLAIDSEETGPAGISRLYERARNLRDERFYLGPGQIIYAGDVKSGYPYDTLPPFPEQEWMEALQQLRGEDAEGVLGEFLTNVRQLRIDKPLVYEWGIDLLARLEERLHSPSLQGYAEPVKRATLYQSIYDCQTLEEIEAAIRRAAAHYLELLMERSTDKNARLVQQVCQIIDQTFHEPITIQSLSSQVYLSPNYLRSIFRDKTGMTIHDYLTRIRLEKSKEMLADPSLKVQDIAQKIGYESTSYFISLFLKNQGVTPNEYRKNL